MKQPAKRAAAEKPREFAVDEVFDACPKPVRTKLLALRRLIFDTAKATQGVGRLEETLKWGQPSYLTAETNSGSTVRIDRVKPSASQYAVYFHCQTNLVETFRELYPELSYSGNRAILLDAGQAAGGRATPLRGAGADVSFEEAEAGEREMITTVIARSNATKQSSFLCGTMDCFADPVVGRAFARRVGSQ